MDASTRCDGSGVELVTRRASYWTQLDELLAVLHPLSL